MNVHIKRKPGKGNAWREKLERDHPSHGKVVSIPAQMRKTLGVDPSAKTLLIPRPRDVDAVMRSVRKGRLITVTQMRARLAKEAGADCACPLTTGIFLRIAAEAAEEDARAGRARITPYWRTIRDGGKLIEKFPGGRAAQAAKLRAEGFTIARDAKRQPAKVTTWEMRLVPA